MKPAATFDDAIVTSLVPYGDVDLVVRLFTAGRGRVGAFAKAAKKSQRRFTGLSAPARARVGLVERPGSDLLLLEEVDVDPSLYALSADPRALGFAAYVVELVERLVPEGAPVPDVYALVDGALSALVARGADAAVLRAFELKLLQDAGYLPDLGGAEDEPGAPVVAFDPARSHLVAHASPGTVPFHEGARAAALALLHAPVGAPPLVDEAVLRMVSRLFSAHLKRTLDRPLRSVAFLRGIAGAAGDG